MMSQRKSEQKPEQKDAKKIEKQSIGMVEVVALTNVAYGLPMKYIDPKTKSILVEKYVKTGVLDDVNHIDFYIPRCLSPITGKMMPCIHGTAVMSALKEAVGLAGRPLKYGYTEFSVLGIYFDESDANLLVRKITLAKGEQKSQTLSITEIINSGAHGVLLYEGQVPSELMAPKITIGRMKSRGFGRVLIKWQ